MALIGRERELADLDERLRSHRLVTVVGPGGVGKTALADAAAAGASPRFPMGLRRIDLTRVEAAEALPGAVAAQLGYESFEALIGSPGDRPALLVFDNCEHLLDAAAGTIAALLDVCELPTVLATSRSPLELPGEAVVSLAPLAVPPTGHRDPGAFSAVQLFLERARTVGAVVRAADIEVVAHLCRQLDGLPLALELAAARARTLSVHEIAGRLDAGVDVLARRHFRGERRHRSIVDTIRWSYDLLDPSPACLLQQLSVFAGPFTVGTARTVAAAEGCSVAFDDDLEELVYASLVTADTSGPETRYRLLDTVRRFARDQLTACGRLERTMEAFTDAVLAAALDATRGGTFVWRPEMIGELLGAFDDIAEALRWTNAHDDVADRALTLCGLLWTVVHQGRADDVVVLARQTIERWQGTGHPRHGAALATLATAEYLIGEPARALEIAEPALRDLPAAGTGPVKLRRLVGQARSALGDLDGATSAFAEAAEIARAKGMAAMALELDIVHAHVRSVADPAVDVVADLERARRQAVELGSPVTATWAGTTLGWVLLRSDPDRAWDVVRAALEESRALGYPIGVAGNLRSLAFAHLLRGDLDAARATLAELLDDVLHRGALSDVRLLVDATAVLAHRAGHPDWPVLAATAQSLPIISLLLTPGSEPVPLPPSHVAPLPRIEALAAAKRVLAELGDGIPVGDAVPQGAIPGPPVHRFAWTGDLWEVAYDGATVAIRSSKGLVDIARLLAQPGREIHCLDLVGAGVDERSTGEVIDAAARAQYEARIRDLQDDVEEAEAANDLARAERAQVELDVLVDHLASALGVGGRVRRSTGTAERARSTVTQRVRGTIRRVEQVHPALGRHLRASIVTGHHCAYRPEHPTTWVVDLGPAAMPTGSLR